MSIYLMVVLSAMAGCAIGCLLGIYKALEKLAKSISSIGSELKKMNEKLAAIEAVNRDEQESETGLESLEAAISNFEKLKRIDLTKT